MAKLTPSGSVTGEASAPRQAVVYRQYIHLQSIAQQRFPERFSGSLAGRLTLCTSFGFEGAELALATTIAGGVFLGLEPDPKNLKSAQRNGSCDFMVNTLDESLRVLKNELRKQRPLSVGLLGEPETILPAIVERGVQPDLVADTARRPAAFDILAQRGALIFPLLGQLFPLEDSSSEEVIWTAANPQDMRRMDRIALELLPPKDQVRRRWLEQAAGNFYRRTPLERVLELNPIEREHLLEAFQSAGSSSEFQGPIDIRWPGGPGSSV